MTEIIFYFGAVVITTAFIWLMILKFKDEDEIDLSKHKWIIILYILLLIIGIFTWGVIYKYLTSQVKNINSYNKKIEKLLNGKEKNSF